MKIRLTIYSFLISCTVLAQQSFVINGKLGEHLKTATVRLSIHQPGGVIRDSAVVVNGLFTVKGQIGAPARAVLSIEYPTAETTLKKEKRQFFIEPGETEVKGNQLLSSAVIRGGKANQEYQGLQQRIQEMKTRLAAQGKGQTDITEAFNRQAAIEDSFILAHPGSYVSLDLVVQKWITGSKPAVIAGFFDGLNEELKNSRFGKAITRIALYRTGVVFPDFSLPDSTGSIINLASLRGSYVFVDIWASWCKPCRAENPVILDAFNQFRDKKFEVLAVSLDASREAWLKAVREDGMPWKQVRDAQSFQGNIATEFGIQAVPCSFLLDPNGVVIARDLRGGDLVNKLKEVLNKDAHAR